MPPSGYSSEQSQSITLFLRSCAKALAREAAERGETLPEAIARETVEIEHHRREKPMGRAEEAVLSLTQQFYSEVSQNLRKAGGTYGNSVTMACENIERAVLAIKVEPAVKGK